MELPGYVAVPDNMSTDIACEKCGAEFDSRHTECPGCPKHQVIHGKAEDVLIGTPDNFYQMICTSPPYDDVRSYGSKLDWDFHFIAKELTRVLVPGGVICWVVGNTYSNGGESCTAERQKIYFVDQCGLQCHQTIIYQKKNFSHPQKKRYHSVFEYVYVFSKGAPRVFNPLMDRRNKCVGQIGSLGANTVTRRDGSKGVRLRRINKEFGMRHNVWLMNTRGQEEMCKKLKHPAMMPKALARDLILSFSNPGDTVCDPMAGSGTVGQQAVLCHRNAVSIDCVEQYCKLMLSGS